MPASRILLLACLALGLALSAPGCGGGDNNQGTADMAVCVSPQVNCGFGCVSLMTDPGNCGRCNNSCFNGQTCVAGVCVSEKCKPKMNCSTEENPVCVDLATDSANCGACNRPCEAGQPCVAGKCMTACAMPQVPCGGQCVDLQNDKNNCGTCGVMCRLGERCFHGACQLDICGSRMLGMPGNALTYTGGPNDLAAGDIDQDGDVDLIIAGTTDVSLMLNNQDNHQLMAMPLATKSALTRPLVGEFNMDQRTDLAFIDAGNKQAVVYKGDNKNNFVIMTTVPATGTGPYLLFAGLIDGDPRLDLAVVGMGDGVTDLAINTGSATFKAGKPVMFPPGLRSLVAADFNSDNRLDFAYADKDGAVWLLLNLGDATFNAPIGVTSPVPARLLAFGDVDGNMRQDLVVVGDTQAVVLFNEKNNPFPVLAPGTPADSPALPQVAAVVDLDGDALLDVVIGRDGVGRAEGGAVFTLLSDGKKGFKAPVGVLDEMKVVSLAIADFDLDGKADAAFGQVGHDYAVGMLRSLGGGRFAAPVVSDAKAEVTVMAGGDLDGDGAAELVVGTDTLNVWKNDGFGRYTKGDALDVLGFTSVHVRDVDGDKKNDVVVFDGKTTLSVFLGDGKGKLGAAVKTAAYGNTPYMAFGDIDVDGKLDMVQLGAPGALVYKGAGAGGFSPPATFKVPHTGPVVMGDFNNDNWPDLVVVDTPTSFALLVNKSSGNLAPPVSWPAGQNNTTIAAALLDNDNRLDLVLSSTLKPGMGGLVTVVYNDGDGTFKAATELLYPWAISAVTVGDVDNDRFPDIVAPLNGPEMRGLGVWRNPKGKFLPVTLYPGVRDGILPILVDGDGDGRVDSVTAARPPAGAVHQSITLAVSTCLP